jgi:hypothetical protein
MTAQSPGPNSQTVLVTPIISALPVISPSDRHQVLPSRVDVCDTQFRHAELAASLVQFDYEVYMTGATAK